MCNTTFTDTVIAVLLQDVFLQQTFKVYDRRVDRHVAIPPPEVWNHLHALAPQKLRTAIIDTLGLDAEPAAPYSPGARGFVFSMNCTMRQQCMDLIDAATPQGQRLIARDPADLLAALLTWRHDDVDLAHAATLALRATQSTDSETHTVGRELLGNLRAQVAPADLPAACEAIMQLVAPERRRDSPVRRAVILYLDVMTVEQRTVLCDAAKGYLVSTRPEAQELGAAVLQALRNFMPTETLRNKLASLP